MMVNKCIKDGSRNGRLAETCARTATAVAVVPPTTTIVVVIVAETTCRTTTQKNKQNEHEFSKYRQPWCVHLSTFIKGVYAPVPFIRLGPTGTRAFVTEVFVQAATVTAVVELLLFA